jgi:hypothetical protein
MHPIRQRGTRAKPHFLASPAQCRQRARILGLCYFVLQILKCYIAAAATLTVEVSI